MRGSPVDQDRTSRLVHSRVEELLLALGHDVAQVLFQDAVNLLVIAPLGCPLDCRPRSVHRRVGPKEPEDVVILYARDPRPELLLLLVRQLSDVHADGCYAHDLLLLGRLVGPRDALLGDGRVQLLLQDRQLHVSLDKVPPVLQPVLHVKLTPERAGEQLGRNVLQEGGGVVTVTEQEPLPGRLVQEELQDPPDDVEGGGDGSDVDFADLVGIVVEDDGDKLAQERRVLVLEPAAYPVNQHTGFHLRAQLVLHDRLLRLLGDVATEEDGIDSSRRVES
mmetsp:Transcript_3868/g.9571  ORF Transcript_3868/g.9571 Transcript_3868/m.9571 type:complete len:278 (-) Transcript_3868:1005-1838(-)